MTALELEQRLQAIAGQVHQLEVSLQRHDDCQRWSNRSNRSASMSHMVWRRFVFVICDWTIETVFRFERKVKCETIRVWMRKKRNKLLQLLS